MRQESTSVERAGASMSFDPYERWMIERAEREAWALERDPACTTGDSVGDECADPSCPVHGDSDHNLITEEEAADG